MIKAIVAVDKNWGIGKDNQLLFRIPEDMKHFKELTTGNIVVMGSKTYDSIGKPLPNRVNFILTGQPRKYNFNLLESFTAEAYCKGDLDYIIKQEIDSDIFIIGGESVYNLFMDQIQEIYVTRLEKEYDADKHFINLIADGRFKPAQILAEGFFEDSTYTISRWVRR